MLSAQGIGPNGRLAKQDVVIRGSTMSITPATREKTALGTPGGEFMKRLRDGATWGCAGRAVEVIETHISWVFLTPRFAFKMRKPVRFDFLDFSTLALRKADCLQEIALNQRLAPHVYLGVCPLNQDARGVVQLDGKGETVEWVVKMRRLPADAALDRRIERGILTRTDVDRVAHCLTEFYDRLAPIPMRTEDYRRQIEEHIRANLHELLQPDSGLDRATVQRIHAAQLRLVRLFPEFIEDRVRDGRIVEGHGDLRPEHIYLTPAPVVIDCVEFRREFRELDVLDELCFLAMECERLGAAHVGTQILEHYVRRAGDQAPAALTNLYRAYRACVRAKVHLLRARQLAAHEQAAARGDARDYLRLADRYAARLGRPFLLLVRGRSGTGKSSLASALADRLALEHLSTDVIRQELFGRPVESSRYMQHRYSPDNRQRVYDELAQRADELLSRGVSVVVDGTFLTRATRLPFLDLAHRRRAVSLVVQCTCPLPLAQQRIAARSAGPPQPSEAWPELAVLQSERDEHDLASWPQCQVDTQADLSELVQRVETCLREQLGL